MKTLNDVKNLAIELMATEFTVNTYYGKKTMSAMDLGYYFEFDNAKRAFGRCFYMQKKITLSLPLCSENLDKVDTQIRNTILHEIAHALSVEIYGIREGKGHGANWKSVAKQIGCNGERCYNGDSVNKPKSKYTLVCDSCNNETPKYKVVRRTVACGKCCREYNNGKYSDKYRLRLVTNY
jgi:predicted SprT family Zn-dependent metalloprotease